MKYCKKCILPDTRPSLIIEDDGICSACHQHENRPETDWAKREKDFIEVVKSSKKRSSGYDCLIPVSGGKDSTWQVIKCLEHGLKPLAITWKPSGRNPLGRENLENLISLGVDHIDYSINPEVEKRFILKALERYGNPGIPMHFGIYSLPLRVAIHFDIPLIVYGENSAIEYGKKDDASLGHQVDKKWRENYGVTHGTVAEDWVDDELSEKDLLVFRCPSDLEVNKQGVRAVFLGYYFPWDPEDTLKISVKHGFKVREEGPKVGIYNYADIDDDFISVHHYIKWFKFGFTRSYDNLSLEIRNGRISREQALVTLRQLGQERPEKDIEMFCDFLKISVSRFDEIVESFRDTNIWTQKEGVWQIKDFLFTDWDWS